MSLTRRVKVSVSLFLGAAALPFAAWAAAESFAEFRDWLSFLNVVLIPGCIWAARLSAKVEGLHKAFSQVQVHESKIAVLEALQRRANDV